MDLISVKVATRSFCPTALRQAIHSGSGRLFEISQQSLDLRKVVYGQLYSDMQELKAFTD